MPRSAEDGTESKMLLRFFVCRRESPRNNGAWVGMKFCNSGSLEDFPADTTLSSFCFPLRGELNAAKRLAMEEEYSFTMTGGLGERMHAFCRRVHPPSIDSNGARYPVVLCMVSEELWGTFLFKVLEVVEGLMEQQNLLTGANQDRLPTSSSAAWFLRFLGLQLSTTPRPGQILRIPFPTLQSPLGISPAERIPALNESNDALLCTDEFIELQVPPLTGGDRSIAGVSLARLVWRIPTPCLLTLLAGLLLERRILMISRSRDVLSSAVHAAASLLYPFKWHHVYLPIVPENLIDYVMAPIPFLIGLPAQLLSAIKGLPMSEVTVIDLDLGRCEPEPGSDGDDAQVLPMREKLEDAIRDCVKKLRSPSEFEGNQTILGILTDYFVQIFKGYRGFIRRMSDDHSLGIVGEANHSRRSSFEDSTLRGEDTFFDFPAFVQSRKKNEMRQFLALFRQSQMFEVMIQDRLAMASDNSFPTDDCFEQKITMVDDHMSRRMGGLRQPVRSLSKTLSLKRSKLKVALSPSLQHRAAAAVSTVSDLAPEALRKAVSRRNQTIEMPTSPVRRGQSPPKLTRFASTISSTNSEGQSEVESAPEHPTKASSDPSIHAKSASVDFALPDPLLNEMVNLISLDDPILDGGESSVATRPSGSFDESPFGEPDAFASSTQFGSGSQELEAPLDFSDSETWDGSLGRQSMDTFSHSWPASGTNSTVEVDGPGRKESIGVVEPESVNWNQLINSLAGKDITAGRGSTPTAETGARGPSSQTPNGDVPTVDTSVEHPSPFLVFPAEETAGVGPLNSSGNDSVEDMGSRPEFGRTFSRVDRLRMKSQKRLEEMFASNLRSFDHSISAAARPGAVLWKLPQHPSRNPSPYNTPMKTPMREKS
ncbi:hypothetical protein BSKO_03089 [Bryopsis sp. KO-2023]|nr:hypothetical protein BSKO_03089 [Bryopsis sp. KO-2023]